MAWMNEKYALLFFILLIVIAIVLALWIGEHKIYDEGRFHTFIAILAGLGIFLTFFFYYNIIILQGQQQQLAALQELTRLNDTVLNSLLDSFNTASTIIPNFVLSITPLTNNACCPTGSTGCIIPVDTDPVTPVTCTEKMTLSYRIFALWQDVIMSNNFIQLDATAYVSNFLQRANSQQLYEQWTMSKLNFNDNTQTFGDLLFKYGLPITTQTPEAYTTAANQLIADPEYQTIFKVSC